METLAATNRCDSLRRWGRRLTQEVGEAECPRARCGNLKQEAGKMLAVDVRPLWS